MTAKVTADVLWVSCVPHTLTLPLLKQDPCERNLRGFALWSVDSYQAVIPHFSLGRQ